MEEKIKDYFKNEKLEVLDGGNPQGYYDVDHYLAVSIDYIWEYVIKREISKEYLADIIFKLCKEKELLPVPCYHAGSLVFCNYEFSLGRYFDKFKVTNTKIDNPYEWISRYDQWSNDFNKLLNCRIKQK
ncbi:MAG: hypothetical protein ACOC3V_00850 [bacterium]